MKVNGRVLIIEDDETLRQSLIFLLMHEGLEVEGAGTSRQALELGQQKVFDLIVSDVRLPGDLDGIDTVQRIQAFHPEGKTKIILMTGYADDKAPERADQIGVKDYIKKPFDLTEFIDKTAGCLKSLQNPN